MRQQQPPWPFVRIHHRWRTLGAEQQQSAPSAVPGRITLPGTPHEEQISARASPVAFALLCRRPRARGACGMVVSGTRETAPLHSGPAPELVLLKSGPAGTGPNAGPGAPLLAGAIPPMEHGARCCAAAFCSGPPRHRGGRVPHGGLLNLMRVAMVPSTDYSRGPILDSRNPMWLVVCVTWPMYVHTCTSTGCLILH